MADVATLTTMLQRSINTPLLEADPAYSAIKQDLGNIISYYAGKFNDEEAILLYSKKEVYLRLATSSAPSYDLEAQFTKLTKSQRFDHYMKLVEYIQAEISSSGVCAEVVQFGEVTMDSRDGSARNYQLDRTQTATLTVSAITANTADVDWTVFDTSNSRFSNYYIYVSKSPMYDPYEESELNLSTAEKTYQIVDVHKTKLRVKELTSLTKYYLVIVYVAMSGRKTIVATEFTTI